MAFKAHDERGGPRLSRQVSLGASGLARRVLPVDLPDLPPAAAAEPAEAELLSKSERLSKPDWVELLALRARVQELEGAARRVTGHGAYPAQATEGRPWEAEGVSRATWFRRRKAEHLSKPRGTRG